MIIDQRIVFVLINQEKNNIAFDSNNGIPSNNGGKSNSNNGNVNSNNGNQSKNNLKITLMIQQLRLVRLMKAMKESFNNWLL